MRSQFFYFLTSVLVGFTLSAHAANVTDLDGDGMSDVWQRVYSIATGDTGSDPDGDGFTNAQESRAGTNPHDPASRLHLVSSTFNATTATLTWKSENGKKYDIEDSNDLTTWTHFSYADGTGGNKTATVTLAAANKRFYRIRARQTEDDSDEDTLTNWEENLLGTNKSDVDSDGDGMHDDWEFIHQLNPFANDAYADADGDGIPNIGEFYYNYDPQNADTDGDGIADNVEFPWSADLDNDGLTNQQEIIVHQTRADMDDTDADGLVDGWEIANTLEAKDAMGANGGAGDPDGDGLSNNDEQTYGTNPKSADTDGDGVSDLMEINQGSNPKDASDGGLPPANPPQQLTITWGDPSSSHSEKYRTTLTSPDDPEAPYFRTNPNYGEVNTYTFKKVKIGKQYFLTMEHRGSDPKYRGKPKPDFDYTLTVATAPCLLIDDPAAAVPTTHGMLGSHANDEPPHADGSFWAGGKEVLLCFPKFQWVTPKDSPMTGPDDTLPGQNEFTFTAASPGVLNLEFEVKVEPGGIADKLVAKGMVSFSEPTTTITGSTYVWEPANATPPGKPTVVGDNLKANATYTTLPASNSQFGAKKARFACTGVELAGGDFEVFFPKSETNHPGIGAGSTPNWYFYWAGTAVPGYDIVSGTYPYAGGGAGDYAQYNGNPANPIYTIHGPASAGHESYNSAGLNVDRKGIDTLAATLVHEKTHRQVDENWLAGGIWFGKMDTDGDELPDDYEDANVGLGFNKNNANSFPGFPYGDDEEVYCERAAFGTTGNANLDWANPGKQSKNPF